MTGVAIGARAALIGAAAEAGTNAELGAAISQWIGRVVPHDGYMLAAVDPVTGAGSFLAREHGYSPAAARRLTLGARAEGDDPVTLEQLVNGPRRSMVLNTDGPGPCRSPSMRAVMAGEGVGSELRVALAGAGVTWGGLVLVRARGSRPFSAVEAEHAQRLGRAVVAAMKRYVSSGPLEPSSLDRPPGVLVVGADETVVAATPSVRDWIAELGTVPAGVSAAALAAPAAPLESTVWNLTQATRGTGAPCLTRVPTRRGWIVLRAQPMTGAGPGAVAVTIQPATGTELLPAMALWHGLSPRESAIVGHVLQGMAAKQIARRLEMSPHTLNDHFKSIYRKTGVRAREELIAGLLG
ncbi:LuxR C-terminal-related transcriptional regulator [Actinomadura sp. NPDC000600]|uniref:helix-turn-helix transcriptional regulator n=1 Tax=Actinomadura sp. NPDC000600 TaxID=3154262 RepID=UPI0033926764